MGAWGWVAGIITVLIVLVFLIKGFTKKNDINCDEDELESRMSGLRKFFDDCCKKKKGRHRI